MNAYTQQPAQPQQPQSPVHLRLGLGPHEVNVECGSLEQAVQIIKQVDSPEFGQVTPGAPAVTPAAPANQPNFFGAGQQTPPPAAQPSTTMPPQNSSSVGQTPAQQAAAPAQNPPTVQQGPTGLEGELAQSVAAAFCQQAGASVQFGPGKNATSWQTSIVNFLTSVFAQNPQHFIDANSQPGAVTSVPNSVENYINANAQTLMGLAQ